MSSKQHKDYDFLLYRIESLERRLDNMKSSSSESELLQLVLRLIENKNVAPQTPQTITCTTQQLAPVAEDKPSSDTNANAKYSDANAKYSDANAKYSDAKYDSLTFARRRTMT